MPAIEKADDALAAADEAMGRWDVDGVIAHLSTAIREFTAADQPCRAAMACIRLGDTFAHGLGNLTAGRAWYARARRLVEGLPPCLEQGWVAVAAMGCDVADPAELLRGAEMALDRARTFGDVNLETKALADGGLAHVQSGRIAEGMALLDEAMALACGPADDAGNSAKSVCSLFTACYLASDFDRADDWTEPLRKRGLIGPDPGGAVFLSTHCDRLEAALLVELGRWTEAEAVLTKARADFEAVMPGPGWHAEIGLAELRLRQGRLADAEVLLLGRDQVHDALIPMARLHLLRGDHDLARATARRGLRTAGDDRLRVVELLSVLVEAELARGDLAAARIAAEQLGGRAEGVDLGPLRARAAVARARVLVASGGLDEAVTVLEAAVDGLDPGRSPWLRAALLLDLARGREAAGDDAGAQLDATAAAALIEGLDVVVPPDDAATIARLATGPVRTSATAAASDPCRPVPGGCPDGRRPPRSRTGSGAVRDTDSHPPARAPGPTRQVNTATLRRDGRWWTATYDGTTVRLRASKGMAYLAELLAVPGVERHALDLVDRVEGVDPDGLDRRLLGDAGPALDGRARAAYRRRIEELRDDIEDAFAAHRIEAAESAQTELDVLVEQLAGAFGLGGRERRASSAVERSRLNVTRALRTAIAHVVEGLPAAGPVLDRGIRTGTYCVYDPHPGDALRWVVEASSAARPVPDRSLRSERSAAK